MIRSHRAMLERDSDASICGYRCDRLPKLDQARQKIFERFVDWIISFWMTFQFDHCARKSRNGLHADTGGDFNGAKENGFCKFTLLGIQRISIKRANRRDANVSSLGLAGKFFRRWFPILFLRCGFAGFKSVPTNGTEAISLRPIEP